MKKLFQQQILIFIAIVSMIHFGTSIIAQDGNENKIQAISDARPNSVKSDGSDSDKFDFVKANQAKELLNGWVKYDSKLDILVFKNRKTYLYTQTLLDAHDSTFPDEDTGYAARGGIYSIFESLFPGFTSLNKHFFTLEESNERSGIREPENGYAYEEGFIDDAQTAILNVKRAYQIANVYYRYLDVNTLYETNNKTLGEKLVTCEASELSQLKEYGVTVHHLGRGTIEADGIELDFQSNFNPSRSFQETKAALENGSLLFKASRDSIDIDSTDCDVTISRVRLQNCNTVCFDGSATIDGMVPPAGTMYQWTIYNSTPSVVATSGLTASLSWCTTITGTGTFTVQLEMMNGPCVQEGEAVRAETSFEYTDISGSFTSKVVDKCNPKTLAFSGSFSFNSSLGDGFSTCTWTYSQGGAPTTFATNTLTPNCTFPAFGIYTVCCEVKSIMGCVKKICQTVVVTDKCDADFKSSFELCSWDQCHGEIPVKFTWNNGVACAGWTYTWAFGDGTTGTGVNVTHNYKGCGDYKVTLTVKTPGGCVASETKNLHLFPPPWDFTYTICPNGRVRFEAINLDPGSCIPLIGNNPTWNFGTGANTSLWLTWNFLYPCKPIAYYPTGTYTVSMTYESKDGNKCTIKKTITVTKECCARNDRTKGVWYSANGTLKLKGKLVVRNDIFDHFIKTRSRSNKLSDDIKAGVTGIYHLANGTWWEINIQRTKCNCVNPVNLAYTEDYQTSSRKAKKVVHIGQFFAVRKNLITSTHYATKGSQVAGPGNLQLGIDCDLNNVKGGNDSEAREGDQVNNLKFSDNSIKIIPNPVNSHTKIEFTIDDASTAQLGIYNIQGKLLLQYPDTKVLSKGKYTWDVDTDQFIPGMYILKGMLNQKSHELKLIKVNN